MAHETQVTLTLDSASLFAALQQHVADWSIATHAFDADADEVHMSYDSTGTGRIAVTVGFEFNEVQMSKILSAARPAG